MHVYSILVCIAMIGHLYGASMNNPLVRMYAKYMHSQFRKKHIRPFSRIFQSVNEKFNVFIINANGEFYKLSEDEKELLKTLFELMF